MGATRGRSYILFKFKTARDWYRQAGGWYRQEITSWLHRYTSSLTLSVALVPVHISTHFASTNQKSPSKPIVHVRKGKGHETAGQASVLSFGRQRSDKGNV